jgi:hypothetical protein
MNPDNTRAVGHTLEGCNGLHSLQELVRGCWLEGGEQSSRAMACRIPAYFGQSVGIRIHEARTARPVDVHIHKPWYHSAPEHRNQLTRFWHRYTVLPPDCLDFLLGD